MINETLWHDERAIFNAVTGQSSNFPQGDGTVTEDTFPAKGTIPLARTMTGTIESDGVNVLGTGTLFETELAVGDYLYDDDGAVRQIKHIESETKLTLRQAFPSDVSGIDVLYCQRQRFKMVTIESTGTVAAILQEAPFAVGRRIVTGGAPFTYDASDSNAQISFVVNE